MIVRSSKYRARVLIYAVQDATGTWLIDPHAEVEGNSFEGSLTVTGGPHVGRHAVRYASCQASDARPRYQLDDYQRFYPTQWVRDLLEWDDPKVAADPVGKLSAYANIVGGFGAEQIAEIEAERSAAITDQ